MNRARKKPVSGRVVVLVFLGLFAAVGGAILWAIAQVSDKN